MILRASNLATRPALGEELCSFKCLVEMGSELIIGKTSSLNSALNQVCSRTGRRFNFVEEGSEPTTNTVAHDGVADLSTNGVGGSQSTSIGLIVNEDNAQRSTATPGIGVGELRELPSGSNPIGHRSHRQVVTALVPTSFQHCPTRARAHPGTKTVRLGPLSLVRLIRPLHRILFSRCHIRFAVPPWGVASDSAGNLTAPVRPAPNPPPTV